MKQKQFQDRHIGIGSKDLPQMLETVGVDSLDELIDQTIPKNIRLEKDIELPEPLTEDEYAEEIARIAAKNKVCRSYIGMGWYDTICPAPIYRNVFENPVWYTSYTPYQAEVSQGRLEALLNFQTMISDLTALPLANASLLDEATAAAEAANMMHNLRSRGQVKDGVNKVFVDKKIFPQTLAVLNTFCKHQNIEVIVDDFQTVELDNSFFGCILQYPNSDGNVVPYEEFVTKAKTFDCKVAVACDLMALTLLVPPGEWGADIAFGSAQRFGIPMYYGGPSAAFFSTKEEFKRNIPGRIIGLSKDKYGRPALRMALQTREQHIKREKATSNICTAQALLATMSSFYAVYHGPEGLKNIAKRIHSGAHIVSESLKSLGFEQLNENFFDTLKVSLPESVTIENIKNLADMNEINLRYFDSGEIGISLDEKSEEKEVQKLISIFAIAIGSDKNIETEEFEEVLFPEHLARTSDFLLHDVFNSYHSETELMRYIKRLDRKDISLAQSMIPLGSCTMKLNAASELLPLGFPTFQNIHPYAPIDQALGYQELISNLSTYLSSITGLPGVSFQPNSGSAGEYAGLITIDAYQKSIGQTQRDIVIIPASAHGTNPASAIKAGFNVIFVNSDEKGNVDIEDFKTKIETHKDSLAAYMITYPSTHGIFEEDIVEMCQLVHKAGGLVYMDGANMNAQVGLTHPGKIGADVCHLNLHKTFAIPHGGGGPGVGPICVAEFLIPFLPGHPVAFQSAENTVSAAPYGSAGVLEVTYAYIRMMGSEGLKQATKVAILNANYLAEKLKKDYGIVYRGARGRVGHELILECRQIKEQTGITEENIAKRMADYGYHAPTLSFPVHGTLMIEPTESESLSELTKFLDMLFSIRREIQEIEDGKYTIEDNVLVNAPHPQYEITADEWNHSYGREKAAYPLPYVADNKFWVNVAQVDNAFGDRNLVPHIDQ